MDTQSSQKRSPRASAKSKRSTVEAASEYSRPSFAASNPQSFEGQYDSSGDTVERVRQARAAADRKMNAFSGDLADYVLVRRVVGQKSSREQQLAQSAAGPSSMGDRQAALPFTHAAPVTKEQMR